MKLGEGKAQEEAREEELIKPDEKGNSVREMNIYISIYIYSEYIFELD